MPPPIFDVRAGPMARAAFFDFTLYGSAHDMLMARLQRQQALRAARMARSDWASAARVSRMTARF